AQKRQQLHISRVRRRAVDRLGGDPGAAPGDLREGRVLQVRQTGAMLVRARKEQVPKAATARLDLELLDHAWRCPPVLGALDLFTETWLARVDALVHEHEQALAQL